MAINGYQYETTIGTDAPNWLSSEVGLTQKTYQLSNDGVEADEYGRKIISSGSVALDGATVLGLVFGDCDVTNGSRAHSVMIAGRVYENRLTDANVTTYKSDLQALGIYFDTAPEVTREVE